MYRIAFTGGGTGGHIYPGIAIAQELQKQIPCHIIWIGNKEGMDRQIVESAGIEFYGIPTGKLRRYFSLKNVTDLFNIAGGFFAARKILASVKPDLLFSKGGFVSVPPCAAAASLGIPVFSHESDYTPGLATKLNLPFSRRIFTAYSDTISMLGVKYREKAQTVGNPVRASFYAGDPTLGRQFLGLSATARILLVLGGSQGARQVNELIEATLSELVKTYVVVHQTGPNQDIRLLPSDRYKPYPYIKDELPHVLAAAELVVGRSGAGTVWEAATAGKPMILIPLAGSGTRGDQVVNARYFEKSGAAEVLIGEDVTADKLIERVQAFAQNEKRRIAMAEASKQIASSNAAHYISEQIIHYIQGGS
ncbi:undecaprenyldiphospho-muramoylpentapeptide beta-N-acetylglucosaminyltransferase [Gracilinema caldarium]|uniref:UDP-N-acetylglucosamine--N-acetylmuramyl-(pentapeptide) pyrophosphoryl-undecaprenol N-acetylglucosamine transferase n=1 Tax=Gracilinema caldarium (strain ATCC 51460 / DSM 7334 / H1) TaxID=744872 RepID=F8EZ65_GRAC1|nr:undecaprenyldiphospho-muramoylpentapeptide beta-N-acetylglucosaminyltransferase [Gracilinema caldarium]AEJ19657.1 UDP-N-acetylglucosamine--N-acetylmuramyl- (pentapeptide) pyrophosphoryl-undecaprenol N-acetylglucosamine transferase [Gracilinema caldarium DSM 7334]